MSVQVYGEPNNESHLVPVRVSLLNKKLTNSRVVVVNMGKDNQRAQVAVTDLDTNKTRTAHVKKTMFGTFMDATGKEYYLD